MTAYGRKIRRSWYMVLIAAYLLCTALFFAVMRGNMQISVHDNLDLFQAQYAMLKNTGTFFVRGVPAPFLGGITRDVLPSELSLTAFLYMILPPLAAYLTLYPLRIIIAVFSFRYLYRAAGACGEEEMTAASLTGFVYGLLPVFPSFGICFASLPLCAGMFYKAYAKAEGSTFARLLAGLFLYPLLSYFSYFGIFILGYAALFMLIVLVRALMRHADRQAMKGVLRLFAGILSLAAGYVVFENRLFGQMLLSGEPSIRETIRIASYDAGTALREAAGVFVNGMMHAELQIRYLVLPVCCLYLIIVFVKHLRAGRPVAIVKDPVLAGVVLAVFNSAVYGLYYIEGFRSLVETLVPPLKGWQFNRTIFFNGFLWYGMFGYICLRLLRSGIRRRQAAAIVLFAAAAVVILLSGSRYNDLFYSAYSVVYEMRNGQKVDQLSYDEFYSVPLFERIKDELSYCSGDFAETGLNGRKEADPQLLAETGAEWAVAYGLHPAILEYNGIATLDGYLGFYEQQYKDRFRQVISPALEARESARVYYDDWGARCYLYSGTEEQTVQAVRHYDAGQDRRLMIDGDALRELGCRYIFSRIELDNAAELGAEHVLTASDPSSPYVIYVYALY